MNTLKAANQLKCKSVSIPAISSGIFGFPKPLCAQVFFSVLKMYVAKALKAGEQLELENVRLCNFDTETCTIFAKEFIKHAVAPEEEKEEEEEMKEENKEDAREDAQEKKDETAGEAVAAEEKGEGDEPVQS